MQFILNAPISAYGVYYCGYNALLISSKRWLLRAACKKIIKKAAGDWEIDTYCKNLSSPGLYAMAC